MAIATASTVTTARAAKELGFMTSLPCAAAWGEGALVRRRCMAAQPTPPMPISSGTSAMLANLSQPSRRSMSSRSARFTSRSSRRMTSMSPRNFSIDWRSASLRIRLPPSPVLLELGELVLHLLQLGGQRLLLLAVAPLGVAAQLVDELEGAVLGAAAAQRDQGIRARQVVERVDARRLRCWRWGRPLAGRGTRARRPRTGRTADRCRRRR